MHVSHIEILSSHSHPCAVCILLGGEHYIKHAMHFQSWPRNEQICQKGSICGKINYNVNCSAIKFGVYSHAVNFIIHNVVIYW